MQPLAEPLWSKVHAPGEIVYGELVRDALVDEPVYLCKLNIRQGAFYGTWGSGGSVMAQDVAGYDVGDRFQVKATWPDRRPEVFTNRLVQVFQKGRPQAVEGLDFNAIV